MLPGWLAAGPGKSCPVSHADFANFSAPHGEGSMPNPTIQDLPQCSASLPAFHFVSLLPNSYRGLLALSLKKEVSFRGHDQLINISPYICNIPPFNMQEAALLIKKFGVP